MSLLEHKFTILQWVLAVVLGLALALGMIQSEYKKPTVHIPYQDDISGTYG